jgi:hypothetical protein
VCSSDLRADAGTYDVVITAGSNQVVSTAATLTVNWRPDFDNDDDVDLADFVVFQRYFSGPGMRFAPGLGSLTQK